jgi:hypothetical protein
MFFLKNGLGVGACLFGYWLGRGVGGWGGGLLFGFLALCGLGWALDRWDTQLRLAAEGRVWARDIVLSIAGVVGVLLVVFLLWGK